MPVFVLGAYEHSKPPADPLSLPMLVTQLSAAGQWARPRLRTRFSGHTEVLFFVFVSVSVCSFFSIGEI